MDPQAAQHIAPSVCWGADYLGLHPIRLAGSPPVSRPGQLLPRLDFCRESVRRCRLWSGPPPEYRASIERRFQLGCPIAQANSGRVPLSLRATLASPVQLLPETRLDSKRPGRIAILTVPVKLGPVRAALMPAPRRCADLPVVCFS